ncbi:hypothetical protein COD11_26140, partial [Bacillus sp. AFS040349]
YRNDFIVIYFEINGYRMKKVKQLFFNTVLHFRTVLSVFKVLRFNNLIVSEQMCKIALKISANYLLK